MKPWPSRDGNTYLSFLAAADLLHVSSITQNPLGSQRAREHDDEAHQENLWHRTGWEGWSMWLEGQVGKTQHT